ncbi:MAG TPA: ferritin-like domain-containing protein [Burkholderiaceae bacterium]|nr:ferritin-like domain-containing protein [Burkholderiaceae bacterium]
MPELRMAALESLRIADHAAKVDALAALSVEDLTVDTVRDFGEPDGVPGRPERPVLVRPAEVPQRSVASEEGRAALLHALAHIEFNAINLALDIAWRFAGLPEDFYRDWVRVAAEEAHHFSLLQARLLELGVRYGDLPAHDGLWDMARRTRNDLCARLALVPRTLEARGLDASPAVRAKFARAGDARSARIVDVILNDEIGHVATGNRWFKFVCRRLDIDPWDAQSAAAATHRAPVLRGPFNLDARRAAGFTEEEIQALSVIDRTNSP